MTDRKPPSTLDILFVLPWFEREDLGHAIFHQGVDLAGAIVTARAAMSRTISLSRAEWTETNAYSLALSEQAAS
jgi:hypothetical protein